MFIFNLLFLLECLAISVSTKHNIVLNLEHFSSDHKLLNITFVPGSNISLATHGPISLLLHRLFPLLTTGLFTDFEAAAFDDFTECLYFVNSSNLSTGAHGIFSLCGPNINGFLTLPQPDQQTSMLVYYIEPSRIVTSSAFPVILSTKYHRLELQRVDVFNYSNWISDISNQIQIYEDRFGKLTEMRPQPHTSHSQPQRNHDVKLIERLKRSTHNDLSDTTTDPFKSVRVPYRPGQREPYILELYMIIDEALSSQFRGQYDRLIYRVNKLITLVNALYAPLNVNIVIVQLEIWEQDRVRLNVEEYHLLVTLAQFKRMHAVVRHDCLHALLGVKDPALGMRGKANPMTMCVYSRCVGYSRDSATSDVVETARIMAHELGHNFGLRHDTEECECQGCIMATGVEFGTTVMKWSPCSIRDFPGLLDHGMGVCLKDSPPRGSVTSRSIPTLLNQTHSSIYGTNPSGRNLPVIRGVALSVVYIYDWKNKGTPVTAYRTVSRERHLIGLNQYSDGLCGNGQLDPGEECDCGTQTSCPIEWQACCDVVLCRLRVGSECAGGPCCGIEQITSETDRTSKQTVCRLKPSGTICRNESGICDLPEYCDGRSQWCPADVYKADGELCHTEAGYRAHCIRGGCRDPDSWCRVLWGKTGRQASQMCFQENSYTYGKPVDKVANCGIKRPVPTARWNGAETWSGIPCQSREDIECGRLWCYHQNEKAMLLGWIHMENRAVQKNTKFCSALVYDPVWPASDPVTWSNDKIAQINSNGAGFGQFSANTQDAGMVPDGSLCSRGFCYNGTCKSVRDIPSRLSCYCNGRGVCNNLGHCHCWPGFKPPTCEHSGDGGSIDSGPPPRNKREIKLLVVICTLFFIILPATGFLVYWLLIRPGKCIMDKSSKENLVTTTTGLRKPFDKSCISYIYSCCSFPASLTEFVTRLGRSRNYGPVHADMQMSERIQSQQTVWNKSPIPTDLYQSLHMSSTMSASAQILKPNLMGATKKQTTEKLLMVHKQPMLSVKQPIVSYYEMQRPINQNGEYNGTFNHVHQNPNAKKIRVPKTDKTFIQMFD